jgi:hypothetical protein
MACNTPPPGIPMGLGNWVKKDQLRDWLPRMVTYPMIQKSGIKARMVIKPVSTSIITLTILRLVKFLLEA